MPRIKSVSPAVESCSNSPAAILAREWLSYVVAPDQMEVVPRRAHMPMQCGVYVLWDGSRLLYVGSSLNVQNRIAQHVWAGKIPFDSYSVVEVNDERILLMLEAIENAYIEALDPPFNSRKKGIRMRDEAKMAKAIKAAWDACLV